MYNVPSQEPIRTQGDLPLSNILSSFLDKVVSYLGRFVLASSQGSVRSVGIGSQGPVNSSYMTDKIS